MIHTISLSHLLYLYRNHSLIKYNKMRKILVINKCDYKFQVPFVFIKSFTKIKWNLRYKRGCKEKFPIPILLKNHLQNNWFNIQEGNHSLPAITKTSLPRQQAFENLRASFCGHTASNESLHVHDSPSFAFLKIH